MTVLNRIDESICAGRKNGVARGGENARPKAAEILSKGETE
jgi:hypothetical protein